MSPWAPLSSGDRDKLRDDHGLTGCSSFDVVDEDLGGEAVEMLLEDPDGETELMEGMVEDEGCSSGVGGGDEVRIGIKTDSDGKGSSGV